MFCFLLFLCFSTVAQTPKYSRAKVNLLNKDIKTIIRLGIEADHGIYQYGRHLINDFNEDDIALMRAAGYEVEILIEDMAAYYKNPDRDTEEISTANRIQGCTNEDEAPITYETPENYQIGSMAGYLTYEEMQETLDSMYARYPNLISKRAPINGDSTVNGNVIEYLKISDFVDTDEDEPKVLYTALHHAREPNSLSQMIFYMWYLLENYETDEYVKFLVDNTQMYFIPCINPDGYQYNFFTDPNGGGFWRKNRNGSGVDLNRNYDFEWGYDNQGSSTNPSSETYRGTGGFSEKETQAVRDLCLAHDFKIALNYHCFGNLLIHPWGYIDGPTEEDDIFKAFGRAMTAENNYLVGTGLETVGYTVNGDSDDWMYGEQDVKNRIYSMTPEVGTQSDGFWPAPSRIDVLNKANLRQNFETAHLSIARFILENSDASEYISEAASDYEVFVRNIGLQDGSISAWVSANDKVQNVSIDQSQISLDNLSSTSAYINFDFVSDIKSGDPVVITVYTQQENYIDSLVIRKTYLSGNFEPIIQDSINSTEAWQITNSWDLTTTDFVSAPTSMTDSPNGNYGNNVNSTISHIAPVDLSSAVAAVLKFNAKWAIEAGYDYVQVLASTDGGTTRTPLCGRYTVLGNSDQDEGQPLYQGNSPWVAEEINLVDYLGFDNLEISFRLISDGFVTFDGFYFDDLIIEQIKDETNTTKDLWSTEWNISPNPTTDYIDITPSSAIHIETISIYDVQGKLVWSSAYTQTRIDLSGLSSGLYSVVVEGKDMRSSKQVVRQ